MIPKSEIEALEHYEEKVRWVFYLHFNWRCAPVFKEDLLQEGRMGVINAYQEFDADIAGLSTFTESRIRKYMATAFYHLVKKHGPVVTSLDSMAGAHSIPERDGSLDYTFCTEEGSLEKLGVSLLGPRNWRILYDYVGLGYTYQAIGDQAGLSKERCRQIVDRGLHKLRIELKHKPSRLFNRTEEE